MMTDLGAYLATQYPDAFPGAPRGYRVEEVEGVPTLTLWDAKAMGGPPPTEEEVSAWEPPPDPALLALAELAAAEDFASFKVAYLSKQYRQKAADMGVDVAAVESMVAESKARGTPAPGGL